MRKVKLRQRYDDKWFTPGMKDHLFICCDCALTHWVEFKIVGKHIKMKAKRAPRYTAKFRKEKSAK